MSGYITPLDETHAICYTRGFIEGIYIGQKIRAFNTHTIDMYRSCRTNLEPIFIYSFMDNEKVRFWLARNTTGREEVIWKQSFELPYDHKAMEEIIDLIIAMYKEYIKE